MARYLQIVRLLWFGLDKVPVPKLRDMKLGMVVIAMH